MPPVTTNADCQPQLSASHGTMSGAATAPTLAPALAKPIASARSFFGNHSARVLTAAGYAGDSVTPSSARTTPKVNAPRARPCSIAAALHAASAMAYPSRVPIQSSHRPAAIWPNAYDSANADVM